VAVINDNGYAVLTAHDALNRPTEINRSMPALSFDLLQRADVNGDEVIDEADVAALEEDLP